MFSDSSASPGIEAARFATLPGRLHTPDSSPDFGTARPTHASVEYLRTHAGLGQDSHPAKQYRMQLHVTTNDRGQAQPPSATEADRKNA